MIGYGVLWGKRQKLRKTDFYLVHNYTLDFPGHRIVVQLLHDWFLDPKWAWQWTRAVIAPLLSGEARAGFSQPAWGKPCPGLEDVEYSRWRPSCEPGRSPLGQLGGLPTGHVGAAARRSQLKTWKTGLQPILIKHLLQMVRNCSGLCVGNKRCGLPLLRSLCISSIFGKVINENGY